MVSADYLPPPEPVDNPPAQPKRSAGKTIALWLVLIVIFLAIYQLVGSSPAQHGAPRDAAPQQSTLDLVAAIAWRAWPLALMALFIWWVQRQLRGGSKLNERLEPGQLAAADGDFARAVAVFREVAELYRGQATYFAACRLHVALSLERLGELDAATDELIQVERGAGLLYGSDVRLSAAIHLARLFALRGELEAAAKWATDARRRLRKASSRLWAAAQLHVAEAVLLARSAPTVEALRFLESAWARVEESLSVTAMRPVWLLRAFLVAQETGPRDHGTAEPWLRMLRTARPGELAYLSSRWPELRAFMELSSVGGGGGGAPSGERLMN
jgi:hypothetical protein